ncbi:MAG TPA: LapA family protein [Kouleothrix sp.]|uniref:lipopolysaccharide assembly protein LapA domain-containing protein n=1 Tax=Kouleothrix sp. TaxID=2779161 RepID=UPI002BFE4885|nr:LapA family protein [Kouleothrix sp.]
MTRYLVLIPLLIVAVLLVLFGVQNTQVVTIRFLSYSVENLSVSLVIVIAALFGALLVALLNLWAGVQRSLRQRGERKERADMAARHLALQKRVAELERENAGLRDDAARPKSAPTSAAK